MKNFVNPSDFTRVNSDTYGNPRYVINFKSLETDFINQLHEQRKSTYGAYTMYSTYELVCAFWKDFGFSKYDNKIFGGGLVIQSYSLDDTCKRINERMNQTPAFVLSKKGGDRFILLPSVIENEAELTFACFDKTGGHSDCTVEYVEGTRIIRKRENKKELLELAKNYDYDLFELDKYFLDIWLNAYLTSNL